MQGSQQHRRKDINEVFEGVRNRCFRSPDLLHEVIKLTYPGKTMWAGGRIPLFTRFVGRRNFVSSVSCFLFLEQPSLGSGNAFWKTGKPNSRTSKGDINRLLLVLFRWFCAGVPSIGSASHKWNRKVLREYENPQAATSALAAGLTALQKSNVLPSGAGLPPVSMKPGGCENSVFSMGVVNIILVDVIA